jgi:hypothetical protein
MKKRCSKCGVPKSLLEFSKSCKARDGLQHHCKLCHKDYREKNKSRILSNRKAYYKNNAERLREKSSLYYDSHRDLVRISRAVYRAKNRDVILEKKRADWVKHSTENKKKLKTYREDNKKILNEKRKERLRCDVEFKIKCSLRMRLSSAVRKSIKGGSKSGSAVACLGIPIEHFKRYLESKFYPRSKTGELMTWFNYGRSGWHIDHIVALSNFDLRDISQVRVACHYTNLQPLWCEDNLEKGYKLDSLEYKKCL